MHHCTESQRPHTINYNVALAKGTCKSQTFDPFPVLVGTADLATDVQRAHRLTEGEIGGALIERDALCAVENDSVLQDRRVRGSVRPGISRIDVLKSGPVLCGQQDSWLAVAADNKKSETSSISIKFSAKSWYVIHGL